MRIRLVAVAVAMLAMVASPARADLIGQQVYGSLTFGDSTNYFLASNGYVPFGYGNKAGQPVTIGNGTEFGFQDNNVTETADFSGTTLTISAVTNTPPTGPFTMRFTPVVTGLFTSFSQVRDTFGGTLSLSGGVLTYSAPNYGDGLGGRTAVYTIGSAAAVAAVPEPASFALLGGAVLGIVASRRRRG